jgi:DNA/RNA endonuclease YhcR with UshA esterase domain
MRYLSPLLAAMLVMLACQPQLFALTPEEAAQNIGKEGAVDGLAVQVSQSSGNVFVNLGAKFPDHLFTAFVAKEDVDTVGLDYLKSMEGKTVSVVGRITLVKGKPQIQVTKKDQIISVLPAKQSA